MAFIADCFEATVAAVDVKTAAGDHPTPTIISYILRDQTSKAQGLLRKQSNEVMLALCLNGFATIGWDFIKNKGVGETPPDIEKVQAMLRATAAKIRTAVSEANTKLEPTPAELQDLSKASDRLWQLDINRLTPENGDYEINLQEGKRWGDKRDIAPDGLFFRLPAASCDVPPFPPSSLCSTTTMRGWGSRRFRPPTKRWRWRGFSMPFFRRLSFAMPMHTLWPSN